MSNWREFTGSWKHTWPNSSLLGHPNTFCDIHVYSCVFLTLIHYRLASRTTSWCQYILALHVWDRFLPALHVWHGVPGGKEEGFHCVDATSCSYHRSDSWLLLSEVSVMDKLYGREVEGGGWREKKGVFIKEGRERGRIGEWNEGEGGYRSG